MIDLLLCGVRGCRGKCPADLPTCRRCWALAPEPLRDALWRAYRNGGVRSPAYHRARAALCSAVKR